MRRGAAGVDEGLEVLLECAGVGVEFVVDPFLAVLQYWVDSTKSDCPEPSRPTHPLQRDGERKAESGPR